MRSALATAWRSLGLSRREWLTLLAVSAGLLWTFWPTLAGFAGRWRNDTEYSHGYFVPLFSLYLLWARREALAAKALRPSWLGLLLVLAGLGVHFAGVYLFLEWLPGVALLICLAGLVLLGGGWPALRWAWPAIGFLIFMVPLPYRAEVALAHPLQRVATASSTYALQTFGITAFAEGNVIRMGQVRIGVVEACSGLSMLLIFFALSTAAILIIRRPWWEKVVIFGSAVPIAITANVVRITITGVLHKTVGSHLANLVFHDLAGWLMMPLALGLLWLELRLLNWVFVPKVSGRDARPLAIPRRAPARSASLAFGQPGAAAQKPADAGSYTKAKAP
jgi:exosortase